MLKKINRLSSQKDFEELKKEGRKVWTPLFGLVYKVDGERKEEKKVGMVVSKKISKKAVERNKIRRLMAEAIRNYWEEIPEGFVGVLLATKQSLGKKFGEIDEKMGKIVKLIR